MSSISSLDKYRLQQAKLLFRPSVPPVRFIIDKKELRELPPGFLADKSPYFCQLVENESTESSGNAIEWSDVTSETFDRLVQALLTGNNYEDPLPDKVPSPQFTPDPRPDSQPCSQEASSDGETSTVTGSSSFSAVEYSGLNDRSTDYDFLPDLTVPFDYPCSIQLYCNETELCFGGPGKGRPVDEESRGVVETLNKLRYCVFDRFRRASEQPLCPSGSGWTPGSHGDDGMSYLPVFMGHFNLFKLADKVQMDWLSKTCLYRLRQTLCTYVLHHRGVTDLANLICEIYSKAARGSPARDLIAEYISCFYESLCNEEEFVQVTEGNRDIRLDIDKFLRMRLIGNYCESRGRKRRRED